jgi:hypothetical protein
MSKHRAAAVILAVVLVEGLIALIATAFASYRPYTWWEEFESGNIVVGGLAALVVVGYLVAYLWIKGDEG